MYIVEGGGTGGTLPRVVEGTTLENSDVVALLGDGVVVNGGDVDGTTIPLYTVELLEVMLF